MIDYKHQVLIWVSSFAFSIALLTTVFNATNPDYNFPGISETLLIGVSFLSVANSLFIGKTLTQREWILGGILFFLIGTLAIRYLFGWNDAETIPSRRCIWMPGYFAKLECLLQLPFKSHHGLRQILFHITALSVFIGFASLSRMTGVLRPWLVIPLAIPAVFIAISVIIPIYYDPKFSLTGHNFVYSPYEIQRGKGIIANPSWLWPWLTPIMGMSLASIFSKKWILKGIGLILFCICAWASISVMQRGGYLIIGVFISTLIILFLYRIGKNWSKIYSLLIPSIGLIAICYLVFNASRIQIFLNFLQNVGFVVRPEFFHLLSPDRFLSIERFKMWDIAWHESIQENFWLGTGYGTWLREFSILPGSKNISFDTAHNLWIQLIFELGVIHAVAIVIILGVLVITTLIYKNSHQPSLKIGGLFLTIGFFVASILQEIDYILPVYLQFAAFAGICFGGNSYPYSLNKLSPINQFRPSNKNGNQRLKTNKIAWIMVGVGSMGVLSAFYYASSISWGGSTFEPTQQAFNRWFRPVGVIAAVPDRRNREYSIFWSEHNLFEKRKFITSKNFPDIWIQENAIFLKNGSIWNPNQFWYESQNKIYHSQRLVSFALHQPHGQTNSVMLAENGMYSWEFGGIGEDGVKVGRWCKKQCNFLLYHPNIKNQPHGVRLQMPLSGLNENHPVKLFLEMESISNEIPPNFSEKIIQQMIKKPFTKNSARKELVFSNPEVIHQLPIKLRPHQIWLISLKTDRTIIPKELDQKSTDGRELGVRVFF